METQRPRELQYQRSIESELDETSSTDFSENGHLLEKEEESIREPRKVSRRWIWICLTTVNVAVMCVTLFACIAERKSCRDTISYEEAYMKTQEYSPVYKSFSPTLHKTTINGTLFNYPHSPFRNDPAPEVDHEWDRISPNRWLLFTRSEILALGKDPSTRAQASPQLLHELGYPPNTQMYYGWIDSFHQTHCLNVLRKHSYWDYYYAPHYGTWDSAHELHWTHVSHCLDIIRQNLECNANADIITHVWKEGQAGPFPDFNIQRKCNDFEGLRRWQEEKMVPDDLVDRFVVRPKDEDIETLYPAPPELFLVKGVEPEVGRVFDHVVERPKHFYSSW